MLLVLAVGVGGAAQFIPLPGERATSRGQRNQSAYVRMRDGVPIAVDVWLPQGISQNGRVGSVIRATRYWRAGETGWLGRSLAIIGVVPADPDDEIAALNAAGYAVALVDVRGTGASGGARRAEWSPEEVADLTEITQWISSRRWSNGRVAAIGTSYDANAAELLAAALPSALRAVISVSSDFDPWAGNVRPGGVFNGFADEWGKATRALDSNDVCAADGKRGFQCWLTRQIVRGVKPVDGEGSAVKLSEILAARRIFDPSAVVRRLDARDDALAPGLTLSQTTPFGMLPRSGQLVPMQVWAGWLDAMTADGALARFLSVPSAQEVWIGPWSHGVRADVDPFAPVDAPLRPDPTERLAMMIAFLNRHMGPTPRAGERRINYALLGGGWRSAHTWPPQEGQVQRLFLNGSSLGLRLSTASRLQYNVDFEAGTGPASRWHTQAGGADVVYADRATVDRRLLVQDSAPLSKEMIITGAPIVTLDLAITSADGAVHAYLEAVSPQGRTVMLSEGILRLAHRAASSPASYRASGAVQRAYLRRDMATMVPGKAEIVSLPLASIAARIPVGWKVRLALAGADRPLFQRYPASGPLKWSVGTSGMSWLDLPVGNSDPEFRPPWKG